METGNVSDRHEPDQRAEISLYICIYVGLKYTVGSRSKAYS